jgi:hypothetical protein
MNVPRFNAEASLYLTYWQYPMAQAAARAGRVIHPALLGAGCYSSCYHSCAPDCLDLVGNAKGACFRQCSNDCISDCHFGQICEEVCQSKCGGQTNTPCFENCIAKLCP